MKTFRQHFKEHCKPMELHKDFNDLQIEILASLYVNYLSKSLEPFMNKEILDKHDLIPIYAEHLPEAFQQLGDVLCKIIPDEKVADYTADEVDGWARSLYNLLKMSKKV